MNDTQSRLWQTRYGMVAAMPADSHPARSLLKYGEWMEQELDMLSSWLQEGQTVLEYGAEYGAHALCMAQAVGDSGTIHAVEPVRLAFQLLCANVALNGLRNVHACNGWLDAGAGSVAATDVQARLAPAAEPGEVFRGFSIDSMGLQALHLLKLNIPGTLRGVLAGAGDALRTHRPMIYARLSGVDAAEAEVRALKEHGYRCWSHTPSMFNRDNHGAHAANIFPGCVMQNVIAIPVEARSELDAALEL